MCIRLCASTCIATCCGFKKCHKYSFRHMKLMLAFTFRKGVINPVTDVDGLREKLLDMRRSYCMDIRAKEWVQGGIALEIKTESRRPNNHDDFQSVQRGSNQHCCHLWTQRSRCPNSESSNLRSAQGRHYRKLCGVRRPNLGYPAS
jgi:hypothetical protein